MPYINRDENKNIVGAFAAQQYEGQEYINEKKDECIIFRTRDIESDKIKELIQGKINALAVISLQADGILNSEGEVKG